MHLLAHLAQPPALTWAKAAIGVAACALLWLEARPKPRVSERLKRRMGVALGAVALFAYFQFGSLPQGRYYHHWEMFHYYLGAKYAPELGYTRLYACTAVADAESGARAAVERRTIRDLRTDGLVSGAEVLRDEASCKRRFTPTRWRAFSSDVAWFRSETHDPRLWEAMQRDHGYNPSPVWTVAGHALSSILPTDLRWLELGSLLDAVLIAGTFGLLGWAFGWRVMAVGMVFLGTQAPAELAYNGGSLLRFDWLFLAVAAMALWRRGYGFWAGLCLATTALVRVFPALLWAGPLVILARSVWRKGRLTSRFRRMLAGGATAAALLVPLGALAAGSGSYGEFAEHISMHARTPISNHMSLKTLFWYSYEHRLAREYEPDSSAPTATWEAVRLQQLEEHRWAFWTTAVALTALFAVAVWRIRTLWLSVGLSLLLVITWTDPACYYFSAWVLAAPLTRARRSLELALVGAATTSQLLAARLPNVDDRHVALAALYVLFTVVAVVLFTRPPKTEGWRSLLLAPRHDLDEEDQPCQRNA
jgi:hypothetical protein